MLGIPGMSRMRKRITYRSRNPRKKKGKREEDLRGIPVVTVEHSMDEKELDEYFGEDGWKELPDEV